MSYGCYMTDTEKKPDAVGLVLTWISKKVWGSAGNTHYAQSHGWRFTCDQPRKGGTWVVRGWGPTNLFFYREATTLKAVKKLAEERLACYLTEQGERLVVGADRLHNESCPGVCCGGNEIIRCSECGRSTIHKLDCSKGRTL